jgi:hypothetical protein
MDIPIDLLTRINPTSQSNCIIHKLSDKIYYNEELKFNLPFNKNTFWTHFKFSSNKNDFIIYFTIDTSGGARYEFDFSKHASKQNTWHPFIWPIPSLDTRGSIMNVFIEVVPQFNTCIYDFKLELLGVKDLFPESQYYFLMTPSNMYQFLFSKFEDNDPDFPQGVIEQYENDCYNEHLVDKAFKIKIIDEY